MPSMLSWINLADSAASVTATLEAVGLGVRNLLTDPVAEVWRVRTLPTSSATHLEITLATPATIGVVALFAPWDGYLPPAYAVEVIGSTTALGASEAIYVPPAAMNLAANRGAWWHWPAAPVTLRYLRIKVVSGAGDQYLQLGWLWLGPDFWPAIQASRAGQARGVGTAGTTMQWNAPAKGWNAGAVMADASLNRRQTSRVGAGVAFAQVGIVGFDGQIELEALRLFGLPEAAPAVLYACPSVPIGTRSLTQETTWDLPSLTAGATANIDVTVPGARRGDYADASLDTSSIAFVLDCHVWSNNSVRVTARNVSASTVDLASAGLSLQVVKRRVA